MFEKMIAQQTAKKAKLLDKFLEKHEAQYPFPEDIELIQDVDYMGDGKPCHLWIFIVQKVIKENFQSCSICMEEVSFLAKKKRDICFVQR